MLVSFKCCFRYKPMLEFSVLSTIETGDFGFLTTGDDSNTDIGHGS